MSALAASFFERLAGDTPRIVVVALFLATLPLIGLWMRRKIGRWRAGRAERQPPPRPTSAFKCPYCGLINAPEAQKCDCGYVFKFKPQDDAPSSARHDSN